MIPAAQSNSIEDAQTRPLAKRFPKIVSSAPRARFQKARPNVPSFKRAELNSSQAKPVYLESQKSNKEKEQSEKNKVHNVNSDNAKNILSDSKNLVVVTEKADFEESNASENSLNSQTVETPGIGSISHADSLETNIVTSEEKENFKAHSTVHYDSSQEAIVGDAKSVISSTCGAVGKDAVENLSEECLSQSIEFASDTDSTFSSLPNNNKLIPRSTSDKEYEFQILPNVDTSIANTCKENASEIAEKEINHSEIHENECGKSLEIVERSLQTPQQKEKKDVPLSSISSTSPDKISKYPHLTSILSKKRAEPKKDVPSKKRKRYKKGDAMPERSKMIIADLIYWNPAGADAANVESKSKTASSEDHGTSSNFIDEEPEEIVEAELENEDICSSAPRLIISEDGQINIDEVSLVVSRKKLPEPTLSTECNQETSYSSYRKRPMTKQWNVKDTTIFYKALSLIGTDFGLMEKLLPHRTRRELKLKFKREEKFNIELINRAMYESHLASDANTIEEHIANLNTFCQDMEAECLQQKKELSKKGNRGSGRRIQRKTKKSEFSINLSDSQLNHSQEGTNERVAKRKRKRSADKEMEVQKSVDPEITDKCIIQSKRLRKAKKLPKDFICLDDLYDDITGDIIYNSNGNETESTGTSEKCKCSSKECALSSDMDEISGDSTDIQGSNNVSAECQNESPIEIESSLNVVNIIPQADDGNTNYITSDCEQECITVDIIYENSAFNEVNPLTNVVANEIVMSQEPTKRKRKVPKSKQLKTKMAKENFEEFHPSSTNYTPTDDFTSSNQDKVLLEFTPKSNTRMYSKSKVITPETLISSLQAPLLTPDRSHTQTLLTTLNMSNNRPIAIPITPKSDSSSNPVMILAPSSNTENTIHLYLYNNPAE